MNNVEYISQIGLYRKAYSKEWCDKVITQFNSPDQVTLTRKQDPQAKITPSLTVGTVRKDLRCPLFTYPNRDKYMNELLDPLMGYYYDYITEHPYLEEIANLDRVIPTGHMIQKTNPSEGYHFWHAEWDAEPGFLYRVAVYTLYLNDINEGGETEFLHQSLRIPPETGMLCIFPASFTHTHRGNPPLKNSKYIITGWIEIDPKKIN